MYRINLYLLFFFLGILISGLLLKLLVRSPLARRFGDTPDHRKVHQYIIPRIGGAGMIPAFLILLGLQLIAPSPFCPRPGLAMAQAVIFLCLSLLVTGTLDDTKGINYKQKFLCQFVIAIGVVLILRSEFATVSFLGMRIELGMAGSLFAVFWIVGVMNAFNIIDGIDGLAASVALCGLAATAYASRANHAMDQFMLCLSLMGVVLAFLRFNFSRTQKVFLGDTGSQFLGAILAVFAMRVQSLPGSKFSIFIPLLIVGYPLFDITVAMVRRFVKTGRRSFTTRFLRMFSADNEHLHHRLVFMGMSHLQSTFLLTMVAASMGACALILVKVDGRAGIGVMAYLALSIFLILNRLGYVGLRPWLYFPRAGAALPDKIVGVIEPDDVFFHSLKSFKQNRFQFMSLPGRLTKFIGEELFAVMLYNVSRDLFEEQWAIALRASEYQNCPVIVIAESQDIERMKIMNPDGFKSIRFMEKPVRVPELVRELESMTRLHAKRRPRNREQTFSLAELALRNNA